MLGQELGGLLLGIAADLANHHDALGLFVFQENVQTINEIGAIERITANADAQGLAETGRRGLVNGLFNKLN